MAGRLVYMFNNERALRRERVVRDRTNPLDIYSDSELIERFRFGRQALFDLIEEISPQLQHGSDRNAALSPTLQVLIALRFYANGAFQNTVGDMINVHRTTACRAIRQVSLALQHRFLSPSVPAVALTNPSFSFGVWPFGIPLESSLTLWVWEFPLLCGPLSL